jgi:TonB family protein
METDFSSEQKMTGKKVLLFLKKSVVPLMLSRLILNIFLASVFFLFFRFQSQAQSYELVGGDTINRMDSSGKKQGLWKYWDNNLSLALVCYYENDNPVGKQIYYQKNKTILELEPLHGKSELAWRYFGSGKLVQGRLRKNKKGKFEFVNVKGEKLKTPEIRILTDLMELDASFQGGYYELFRYFKAHIKYPRTPEQLKKEGIVEISFQIKEDGKIGDVRLLSGFDVECNEATLECVKSMPRWRPATKMGYSFASLVKVPVQFKQL